MAAISTVAPSKHAILAILTRTRDVCAEVRLHALKVLRDKVEMRWLSISQRASLLSSSLADRDPAVVTVAAELLTSVWVRKFCNGDCLALLRALDVTTNEGAAQSAVSVVLASSLQRPLVAAAAAQWSSLKPEPAFALRAYLDDLSSASKAGDTAAAEELERVAPELPDFVDALRRAGKECDDAAGSADEVRAQFTLAQLLRAAAHLDMANEHGRVALEATLCERIKAMATQAELLPPLFAALRAAHGGDIQTFQQLVLELVADVEDPLEADDASLATSTRNRAAEADAELQREEAKIACKHRLGEIKAEVADFVAAEDYESAASLKKEADELAAKCASP